MNYAPKHDDSDDEPDNTCPECDGTGIGWGPPDVSRCGHCTGRGYLLPERELDDD